MPDKLRKPLIILIACIAYGLFLSWFGFNWGTILFAIVGSMIWTTYKNKKIRMTRKALQGLVTVSVGKYVLGLPNVEQNPYNVEIIVTEESFVFMDQMGKELDRIPRGSIQNVSVADRSQVSQRLTVTRLALLGVFALAAPKKTKHKEFCITIDWEDANSTKQITIFELSGSNANATANKATNTLKRYLVIPMAKKIEEKACGYCAETIKADAKICRFCNRDVQEKVS